MEFNKVHVNTKCLKRFLFTTVYALLFHYGYVEYSYPIFEYAGYKYFDSNAIEYVFTYLIAVVPSLLINNYKKISYFGVVLIYIVAYVPSQLMIQFNIDSEFLSKINLQVSLLASFFLILYISKFGSNNSYVKERKVDGYLIGFVVVFNLLIVFFLLYKYHGYMRFVGFADVYDLRFETNKVEVPTVLNYFQMWITYLFIPFFMAVGLVRKKYLYVAFAIFLSLLIYLIQGAKLAVLMIFIVFLMLYVYDRKGDFLANLCLYISVFVVFVFSVPHFAILDWVKSILFIRTLGTPGWTIVHYYEYFTVNGYSYYGHINIVNFIFGNYPFGDISLGQLIGLEYSGSIDANFNANFWASDGIAALGLPGLFVVSILLGLFFRVFDFVSNGFGLRFLFILTVGFWQALLNIPFATALFSGGGLLIIILILTSRFLTKNSTSKLC